MTESTQIRELIIERLETGIGSDLRDLIGELHPRDIAALLESYTEETRHLIWFNVPERFMGEILRKVPGGVRNSLIKETDHATIVRAVLNLDIDDLADISVDLPSQVITDVLAAIDQERRDSLNIVLSFPEGTAGRLMNVDTVTVRGTFPIRVVMRYLRMLGTLPLQTDKLFVVDKQGVLEGVLMLRTLVTLKPEEVVADHMEAPVTFPPDTPVEDVANAFTRYNLLSIPIVDENQVLLGRITVDDIMDVISSTADRQFLVQAGLDEEEDIFEPTLKKARKRAIWLGVNLITAVIASWVIAQFEDAINQLVALAVLMPIIASMGGNAGTQTLTSVIRELGTGRISSGNVKDVLGKEALAGGLNGLIWGIVVAGVAIVWYGNFGLAAIVAVAMVINIAVSTLSGVLLPVMLKRMGIDPALAGGVALTTVTDVVGFLAILGLASLILL